MIALPAISLDELFSSTESNNKKDTFQIDESSSNKNNKLPKILEIVKGSKNTKAKNK